jgi:hypothetical protein
MVSKAELAVNIPPRIGNCADMESCSLSGPMLQTVRSPTPRDAFRTSMGPVEVYGSARDIEPELWESSFGGQPKDGRFYQIVEDCMESQFTFLYVVMRNALSGEAAVQPAFVVDQDGAAGLPKAARNIMATIRKAFPRFFRLRLLMVGCAAGAQIIVMKDFPSEYREMIGPVFEQDYRRVPGLPAATLELDYTSFEDYLQNKLSKVFRKNLRRKFRKLEDVPPITMEVHTDVTDIADEIFALYWQMFQRAELQFEVLNRDYFERLGREMPEKIRFFVWRQEGRIIAFNLCLVHDGVIYDLDIGMDYSLALGLHLYFVTWRDVIQWSIEQGLRVYHAGPLNYDPKLHLKLALGPQDLYARHVNKWLNAPFKLAMQFMHPVRHNPILRKFENAGEL